jgi:DNA-directed RNA polymerase specialized sigma24 family protein
MARLGHDDVSAGREYEKLRSRIIRFFEWQRCLAAEDLADIALTRLANKLVDLGDAITNPHAYALGVARFVLKESNASHRASSLEERSDPDPPAREEEFDDERHQRAACLDQCLERLPNASRELVLRYYEGEGHEKVAQRRAMAASLHITERALRLRIFRARESLGDCVHRCLASSRPMPAAKHFWSSSHSS